jgi:hypothetical protein
MGYSLAELFSTGETMNTRHVSLALLLAILPVYRLHAEEGPRWFKGNTHTHTWWSDGDAPPETVVAWYREHGYHFLSLTDHNVLSEGEKWIEPKGARVKAAADYEKKFGSEWVVKREIDGRTEYRLKTLEEFRSRFEKPGEFLLIQGEEISDSFEKRPIHINGINLVRAIPPQKGGSVTETIQNDFDAVTTQARETGRPMLAHLNHPNFGWAVTVDEMIPLRNQDFVEIFNGHPSVHNYGDENRPSAERMWDILLTKRLAELGTTVVYGLGTDDAHNYTEWGTGKANPGRAWIMVRAAKLDAAEIVHAMQRGDFYVTTGVELAEVERAGDRLSVRVKPRDGVSYTIRFIGTRRGYDPKPASRFQDPRGFLVNRYSETIGETLSEVSGTSATYELRGDEVYVRAKVISTAKHPNAYREGDVEVAWTQPLVARSRK